MPLDRSETGVLKAARVSAASPSLNGAPAQRRHLAPPHTLRHEVRAREPQGDSSWSASASATPAGVPATPAVPGLAPGSTSLVACWTAPPDGGSAILDYDVRCRVSGSGSTWTEWGAADASTATSATITGLTAVTDYDEYNVTVQVQNSKAVGGETVELEQGSGASQTPATGRS